MRKLLLLAAGVGIGMVMVAQGASAGSGQPAQGAGAPPGHALQGDRLFDTETFGGNGRTCSTCHSKASGTVSPADALQRFLNNEADPLFLLDGSDDGHGNGVSRMLRDATILMEIPLPPTVWLLDSTGGISQDERVVVVRRGIPTTLNTPALDPVLMLDGRNPTLESQARGAILDHAQGREPLPEELAAIVAYEKTNAFFSSPVLRRFALQRGPEPVLPQGRTASEKRGRRFFESVPPPGPDSQNPAEDIKRGLCGHCHSGPLLNQTNEFAEAFTAPADRVIAAGERFSNIGVSEANAGLNPVQSFIVTIDGRYPDHTPDGTTKTIRVDSPDLGRALISGNFDIDHDGDIDKQDLLFGEIGAFKISALWGIRKTAPYFHDNSAKTLEDVAAHYMAMFLERSDGFIALTPRDEQDMVAYMKLL